MKTPGQVAYEAAWGVTPWDEQSEATKALWGRAASAVLELAARKADESSEHGCNPYASCTCGRGPETAESIASEIRALKSDSLAPATTLT